jgi:hypothetical protein
MEPHPQASASSNNRNQCPRCFKNFSKGSALSRHRHSVSPRHLESQHDWNCLNFDAGPLTVFLCSQPGCTTFKFAGRHDTVRRHVKSAHSGPYTPVAGVTQWQFSTKEELQELIEFCLRKPRYAISISTCLFYLSKLLRIPRVEVLTSSLSSSKLTYQRYANLFIQTSFLILVFRPQEWTRIGQPHIPVSSSSQSYVPNSQ